MSWTIFMSTKDAGQWPTETGEMILVPLRGERDGKPVWGVRLPDGYVFFSDMESTSSGNLWQVSGEPPNVTVRPSINIVGSYHGWITDGVISDDVEGRTFQGIGQ